MQMMVKAKYKGPIVSRYCAVAGKIKVAGPWAVGPSHGLHPEKRTNTHTHAHTRTRAETRADGRGSSGDPIRAGPVLFLS